MGFIHRHKLFIGIFSFLFIGLPQYIESIWSLVERLQEVEMTTQFSFDWLYLITMPIGLGMLIFIILQSRKVSKAVIVQPTQVVVAQQYSSQVRDTLDKLIQHGERLNHLMQRDDFHRGQLGQNVRQWLDETEHDVWEIVPEHASHLTSNQASTKEPYTDQERLRYSGWNRQHAALRISVDRRLAQLREIRSRIQVLDTEQSLVLTPHTYAIGLSSMTGYPDKPDNADWLCLEVTVYPSSKPIDTLDLLIGSETIPANDWSGKTVTAFSVYFNVTEWRWKGKNQVEMIAKVGGKTHSSGRIPIDFNVEPWGSHRI